jgi:hypothetical protein
MMRLPVLTACLAAAAAMVGCNGMTSISVVGSGRIEREDRSVSSFREIKLAGAGEVIVRKGDVEELAVETDDNLFEFIKTHCTGDDLEIGFARGYSIRPSKPIRYFVTVRDLTTVTVTGSGDLVFDDYVADKLKLTIAGSGSVSLSNFRGKELKISISGSGSVEADGDVATLKYTLAGSGKLKARDLVAKSAELSISGSGSADVHATDSLTVSISGSASVTYRGEPGSVKQKISGSGSVQKAE